MSFPDGTPIKQIVFELDTEDGPQSKFLSFNHLTMSEAVVFPIE